MITIKPDALGISVLFRTFNEVWLSGDNVEPATISTVKPRYTAPFITFTPIERSESQVPILPHAFSLLIKLDTTDTVTTYTHHYNVRRPTLSPTAQNKSVCYIKNDIRGGSRNSSRGGGGSGPEFFGGGGLRSRSTGIFIYWQAKQKTNLWGGGG